MAKILILGGGFAGVVAAEHLAEQLGDEHQVTLVSRRPKMGHMAVRQAEIAAANLAAEIDGRECVARYRHELRFVIDEIGTGSLYLHKDLWAKRDQSSFPRSSRSYSSSMLSLT